VEEALKDTLYSLVLNKEYVHYQKPGVKDHEQSSVFTSKQITLILCYSNMAYSPLKQANVSS
jgi:hypothetical protein